MGEIAIYDISEVICGKLQEMGFSKHTIDCDYNMMIRVALDIQRSGATEVTPHELQNSILRMQERVLAGEVSFEYYKNIRKAALRIIDFLEKGDFVWKVYSRGELKYPLSEANEKVLSDYMVAFDSPSKNSKLRAASCCRWHLHWLEQHRIKKMSQVTTDTLKRHIVASAERYSVIAMRIMLTSLRRFYSYLFARGLVKSDFRLILLSKFPVERKIKAALGRDEVSKVLNSIDRTTLTGARNYAILMLAAMTGLRCIDIIRLKLTDIDWRHGEIHVLQAKTQKPLSLPLTTEVGEAIKEYILNVRPQCNIPEVFVTLRAPFTAINNGTTISSAYRVCFQEAGLHRTAGDNLSFHSIRRSMGLNMAVAGVPMTTVAQVLGHHCLQSTQKYISLNSTHLKECALDFSSIPFTQRTDDENNGLICNYNYVYPSKSLKDCALTFVGIEPTEETI
jgi:integrase